MAQEQAYLFLVFSLTGVSIGILFDFFRVLRKTYKTSDIITYIEDIIFWILAGIIILYSIWYFNNGEIRLFMVIGIILGALIYTLTLSNIFIKINSFLMSIIKKILKFLYKIFSMPINIIKKAVIKIYNKLILIKGKYNKSSKEATKNKKTKKINNFVN